MPTFLVTGATGRQGGSTARELLSQGAKVHAVVRNPYSAAAETLQSQGAKLFKGDLADAEAISRALEGVSGIFYNPPYPGPEHKRTNEIFIQTCAAQKATVTTLVVSTAAGTEKHAQLAGKDPNYPMSGYYAEKAALEEDARAAGFRHLTVLRPSFLMHGYLPPASSAIFPGLQEHQRLVTALKPETKVPHLVAEDLGKFAAAALLEPEKFAGKEINLAAENLTAREIAAIVGEIAGVEVEAPVAEFDADGKAVGVESPVVPYHSYTNMTDSAVDVQALEREYGIPLTSLRDFLAERLPQLKEAVGV